MVRKDDIDGVAAVNDAADDRSHERRRGIADVLGKPLTDQQHAHGRSSTPYGALDARPNAGGRASTATSRFA